MKKPISVMLMPVVFLIGTLTLAFFFINVLSLIPFALTGNFIFYTYWPQFFQVAIGILCLFFGAVFTIGAMTDSKFFNQ